MGYDRMSCGLCEFWTRSGEGVFLAVHPPNLRLDSSLDFPRVASRYPQMSQQQIESRGMNLLSERLMYRNVPVCLSGLFVSTDGRT